MADAIKNQRAQVKGKVTKYVRKLKSSSQLGATSEKINKEASKLEELFDNLNDLHLEYEEVSDEKDKEYLKTITEDYNSIMKLYYNSLKEADARDMVPLMSAIERSFKRIDAGITRLKEADDDHPDLYAIQVDRSGLRQDTEELLSNIQKASVSVDTRELGERTDRILARSDSVLRTLEIVIEKSEKIADQNSSEESDASAGAKDGVESEPVTETIDCGKTAEKDEDIPYVGTEE